MKSDDDSLYFDGETYEPEEDRNRLASQLRRVKAVMMDYQAHTPKELESLTGYDWASISARLRDLRKERFGAYTIVRTRLPESRGLFSYRLVEQKGQINLFVI